jgi:uncharacterized protein (TIGR00369 family)
MVATSRLSGEEQRLRRDWFRDRMERGVLFNRLCRIRVLRWDSGGVEVAMPYADEFSAHEGTFHGGVVSALIDTAGSSAVLADHDFDKGSKLTTVTLSVQFLMPAGGPEIVASATCIKRGGRLHYADVEVRNGAGAVCARGQVVVTISGERPGIGEQIE